MYWQGGCEDINSRVTFFPNMTLLFIVFSQLKVYTLEMAIMWHNDSITILPVSSTYQRNKTFQTKPLSDGLIKHQGYQESLLGLSLTSQKRLFSCLFSMGCLCLIFI